MKKRILGILLCLIMAVGMLPTMAMAQETAPAFNLERDLKDIPIPENLVTCICTTTNESKTYGQLPEGFTTDGKVIKKNGEWTVIVQIEKSTYLKKFNADTGTTHFPDQGLNYSSDFTTPIQFELKHSGGKWELMGQIPTGKELYFTCDGKHKPSVPMFSNITDTGNELVAVSCTNVSGGPSGKLYGLIDGSFTATEPALNDGVYESTITLNAKKYLEKFNADTGILHGLVSEWDTEGNSIDPVFVVKYDHGRRMWVPKEKTEGLLIFVKCEKHETQPQPPEMPMYPTIDNISGLDKVNVGVLCIQAPDQSKIYGLIDGGFTATEPALKEGVYESMVTIIPSAYCNQYNSDTGITHELRPLLDVDEQPILRSFVVKYNEVTKKWMVAGEKVELGVWVNCGKHEAQPQPPNLPMVPTLDNISGLNDKIVAVLCANTQAGQPSGKYYGLLNGGFTSTMPTREGDMYESTLTLIPSVYCNQYSTDTGIPHTVNTKQTTEGLTFVVKYDEEKKMWMPKEDVKPMGIWVNCDKHETSTSVTPVYPPSGGGSTIKPGSNGSNQGDGAVVNPDNNQGDNKDKVDTGNKQTEKTKKSDTMEKVPKTGDNTGMTIWLVLLLLSVGALFGTVAFDRKRKRI